MNKVWYLVPICLCFLSIRAQTAEAEPHRVDVVATEYHYTMPSQLPAGPTLFHFTNKGHQLHHMTLIKLAPGKTLADLNALPPGPFPAWAVLMGGPNSPMPNGGQDEDIVDLTPGHYAVVCLIPGPDGKPHMMHGMEHALTVTPSKHPRAMPASDLSLKLVEYGFEFSGPVKAGQHVIRITDDGNQPHEAEIFRLQPGKAGADVLAWLGSGMQGPPPGMPVAGIAPMAPHKHNTLLVDFHPGHYALLCFVPDAKDGKPHAAHGMIHNFTVQ